MRCYARRGMEWRGVCWRGGVSVECVGSTGRSFAPTARALDLDGKQIELVTGGTQQHDVPASGLMGKYFVKINK